MAKKGLVLRALGDSRDDIVKALHAVINDIESGLTNCGADGYDFDLVDTEATSVYDRFCANDYGAVTPAKNEPSDGFFATCVGEAASNPRV